MPPLSMLFLLGAAALAALSGAWLAGGPALPALVLFAAGCTLFISILAAQRGSAGRVCAPGRC